MDSNRYRITGGMEPENLSGRRPQQRASAPRQANAQPQRRPQTVQQPQRQLRTPQQSAQRPGGAPVIRSGQSVQPLKKSKKKNGRGALKAVIVLLVLAIVSVLGVAAVHAFMLDKPEVRITNTVSGLRLEWEGVENAANYEIFKNSGEWKQLKTTDKTAYTDKKAKNGEEGVYRVRAVSETGRHSPFVKVSLRRIAPVEITDVKVEETSVTLTWSGFDTAKHYELFKRTGSGDQVKIGTFDAKTLSYVDTEIEKNAVYCYAVRQLTSHGESPLPEERSVATMSTKLDSASVKNSPSGVVVSWSGNTDFAVGVNIYRSVAGGKWTLAGTVGTDESSFTDTGAKYGKTAKYKVTLRLNDTAEGEAKSAGSVYAVDPDKKLVALTYDDGPYSPVTNVILDTMEKYGAHCTFFVVGNRVENYNSCVTRAASLGCEIGSHTYQHKYFNQISSSEVRYQLDEAKKVIEKYSGTKCTILRPPGGHVVSGIDYPLIMWSVDTMDWSNRNKDTTLARAKSGVFDGSIVLMHDLYESSGEATVSLVPWLIKNGYQLVTVSELMEARGITMVNGVKYSQARKTN